MVNSLGNVSEQKILRIWKRILRNTDFIAQKIQEKIMVNNRNEAIIEKPLFIMVTSVTT